MRFQSKIDSYLFTQKTNNYLFYSSISNENVGKGDRLKRLCSHMLKHKCFYPLLPIDVNLNLELSQFDHLNMPITPHLMITPSVLRPFIYVTIFYHVFIR